MAAGIIGAGAAAVARLVKVAGIGRDLTWEGGQMTTKARPSTALSGIVPLPGSSEWYRESDDSPRWSPITHSLPGGTVMLKNSSDGASPG
jgi:hypothetical protein